MPLPKKPEPKDGCTCGRVSCMQCGSHRDQAPRRR